MRGRLPSGPEYVEQLEGSASAKERVKVVLQTMAGTCRVLEACERLQISEPRFEQFRRHLRRHQVLELRRPLAHRLGRRSPARDGHQPGVRSRPRRRPLECLPQARAALPATLPR